MTNAKAVPKEGDVVRLLRYLGSNSGPVKSGEWWVVGVVTHRGKYPSKRTRLEQSVGNKYANEFICIDWLSGGLEDGFYLAGKVKVVDGWKA